ncbi:MAG: helix-turn-helix transcriptional regulator [bacterium]|nr:helix-turn-helix transcriptional regulator [bacterium]
MDEKIIAVQAMQDYIETHIDEMISLADLSKVSMYSPWYAHRLFKEYTNYTPSDYIRRLKLSKSAIKLRDEKTKIVEIAFEMGFQSVDGYQRAFAREFGCNPSEYTKHPIPLQLFIPYGVIYNQIRKEQREVVEEKNIHVQLFHKPRRKVLVKRGYQAKDYFEYCEEVGCDVWGLLTSIKSISGEPVCLWLPKRYRKEGTSEYVQGVEVPMEYDGTIPEGFDIIELPEADYLMFQGKPFLEEDYCQAIESVQLAIEKYRPEAMGYRFDQENPRVQLEPIGARGYIEMLPVQKI